MSVYTPLTLADIQPWLVRYGLQAGHTLAPIKGGIENSNFFLTLADGRELVLTAFEELDADEAAFLGPLLAHVAAAGLPVAEPLADRAGGYLTLLAGKPAQLAPRLSGAHAVAPDHAQCHALGGTLANLHLALSGHPLQRPNAHGAAWWNALAEKWRPRLDADDQTLLDALLARYAATLAAWPALPAGLIHGDLFRDNVLFDGSHVSGLLDFSECGHDHWLLDIAITINDFCRDWPQEQPDARRRKAFLDGYAQRRPLTLAETSALPVFLAVSAMRFWLSRLDINARNRSEQRQGEHITEKDPAEMRRLAALLLKAAPD